MTAVAPMPKRFLLVLTNCSDPSRTEEFNRWYTETHVPDVLATPGLVRGVRYQLATRPREGQAGYIAMYELDTDDYRTVSRAAEANMARAREAGRILDCIETVTIGFYEQVSDSALPPA